jgi:hypothetical protein
MEQPTPVIVVEPVKIKKPVSEAKRKQLEGAREKKAVQKKAIEPDSDSSDDEPEPSKKKSKIITKGNNSGSDMEQWGTTAALLGLLGLLARSIGITRRSHILHAKHLRKKKNQTPAPTQVTSPPMQANMLPTLNRSYVGKSGFAI